MGRDEQFSRLVRESARLNARPWSKVSAGIPSWHPRNEDPPADPPTDPPADPPEDPPVDPPEPGSEAERLGKLEAENQRLKREAAQRERERRQAEAAAKKADDERKAEQGEWKKLAEERSEKITELEATIAERDRKDAERDQRTRVESIAERLNFKRPKRAFPILVDELGADQAAETLADDQLTEAALKRIAKNEPELVDTTRRTGAPVNGARSGGQPDPATELNQTLAQLLGAGASQ